MKDGRKKICVISPGSGCREMGCSKGSAKELGARFRDWIWRSGGRDEYLQLSFLFSWPECYSD